MTTMASPCITHITLSGCQASVKWKQGAVCPVVAPDRPFCFQPNVWCIFFGTKFFVNHHIRAQVSRVDTHHLVLVQHWKLVHPGDHDTKHSRCSVQVAVLTLQTKQIKWRILRQCNKITSEHIPSHHFRTHRFWITSEHTSIPHFRTHPHWSFKGSFHSTSYYILYMLLLVSSWSWQIFCSTSHWVGGGRVWFGTSHFRSEWRDHSTSNYIHHHCSYLDDIGSSSAF